MESQGQNDARRLVLALEAEALRTQKLRLEEQISRAQDASLSVSRVSSLQLEAPSWQASTGDEAFERQRERCHGRCWTRRSGASRWT